MEIEEIENLAEIIADDTADRKDRVRKIVDAIQKLLTSDRLSLVEWAKTKKQTSPNELKADVVHSKNERNAMYFNKGYNQALTDILTHLQNLPTKRGEEK